MSPTEQRRNRLRAARAWLTRSFPVFEDGEAVKPLKRGIHRDIKQRREAEDLEFSQCHINTVLYRMTQKQRYLEMIIAEDFRYDLNGDTCEEVDAHSRLVAGTLLSLSPKTRSSSWQK